MTLCAAVRGDKVVPAEDLHSPPDWKRTFKSRIFDSHDELTPTPGVIWIPRTINNPFFDAVIFEPGPGNGQHAATVWVIQLTTVQRHGDSADGYEDGYAKVTAIHNHLRQLIRESQPKAGVDLAWLLIVPYKRQEMYDWSFQSLSRLAQRRMPGHGRVFVQAFDSKENFEGC
ncbi:hypothetical protein D9757_013106 [Collybiopsis confluens]|uniref:Uncharacterized protein n=1 Tax=Collybiopsis confluens TaxID=2823264 RepID=A0A8H5FTQ9_9AGAR|nr:hypothetical protein D9757_013106 [Collybiopsis confluens]